MKPGDTIQIRQCDHGYPVGSISDKGVPTSDPMPVQHWIYATVHQVLPDGAFVEVNHPANIEHAARKKVLTKDLRTLDQLQAVAALHPAGNLDKLDFMVQSHCDLNNVRVAIERMKQPEETAV